MGGGGSGVHVHGISWESAAVSFFFFFLSVSTPVNSIVPYLVKPLQ